MRFQFDPKKAASSFKKQNVSFTDVEGVFLDPVAIHREDPDIQGEESFIAVGMGNAGSVLVVVYKVRDDRIRLTSVRGATPKEVKDYEG